MVMVRAWLELRFASPEEARVVWDAVSADDPGSVDGRLDAEHLVVECGPAPVPTVRVTLDDLMACIQAAHGGALFEHRAEDEGGAG